LKQVLEAVSTERFLWLPVKEDSELLTFIESQTHPHQHKNLVFHRGNAFYEFSHKSEDITGKKEVILMDVVRS
jgi:6-phosphogluconate dehydrogenase (decarboxylating)